MLFGIFAQRFADGVGRVVRKIDNCCLGWLLLSKSGQDCIYQKPLFLHLLHCSSWAGTNFPAMRDVAVSLEGVLDCTDM